MQAEVLRNLLRTRPFRPFVIHLPKCRRIEVINHEFAMLSPDGRTLLVYEANHYFNMIDVSHVASVEVGAELLNSGEGVPQQPISPDLLVDQDVKREEVNE